jgi:hypothetical protein
MNHSYNKNHKMNDQKKIEILINEINIWKKLLKINLCERC